MALEESRFIKGPGRRLMRASNTVGFLSETPPEKSRAQYRTLVSEGKLVFTHSMQPGILVETTARARAAPYKPQI